MRITGEIKLPRSYEVKEKLPLALAKKNLIEQQRDTVKNIVTGNDARFLLLIGPCSAFPQEAVIDYFAQLKEVLKGTEEHIFPVARVYTQKPRTINGWKL